MKALHKLRTTRRPLTVVTSTQANWTTKDALKTSEDVYARPEARCLKDGSTKGIARFIAISTTQAELETTMKENE